MECILFFLFFVPRPADEPRQREVITLATLPQMGFTNYGMFIQVGKHVHLTGTHWIANGEIRKDGTLLLLWSSCGGKGKVVYVGVYELVDGDLRGFYGQPDSVSVERDGTLSGNVAADIIRKEGR